MPLERKEIQRRYRERKKATLGEPWFEQERVRRRQYIIPANELSAKALKKKRKDDKKTSKKYRQTQKAKKNAELKVKLPFHHGTVTSKVARKKKISRQVSKANRKIERLEEQRDGYKRKFESLTKKVKRQKAEEAGQEQQLGQALTPRSRADRALNQAGIDPSTVKGIRQQLVFNNALMDEVKETVNSQTERVAKTKISNVLAGRIVKQYRMISTLSSSTGLSRRKLMKVKDKSLKVTGYRRLWNARQKIRTVVEDFYYRDDNSRVYPGKKDVRRGKQKRSLTDYIKNLHSKFLCENPTLNVSFAVFARLRPKEIVTVSFGRRDICLCIKHQNFALKLRAIHSLGVKVEQNPDEFVRNEPDIDALVKMLSMVTERDNVGEVHYSVWRYEQVTDSVGNTKRKMKFVSTNTDVKTFLESFQEMSVEFGAHSRRVSAQYHANREMKCKLPDNHVTVQMDFAENYACKNAEEVQSAYWAQTSVTIHPCVVHYVGSDGSLKVICFAIISDVLSHDANTVYAIIKRLVPEIQRGVEGVDCVHYWTDSPTSQYRNKRIFHIISKHEDLFGMKAVWNYFEAGHGKCPCDGVGGTLKRMADNAVKREPPFLIQDATDFFAWTQCGDVKKIISLFVSAKECREAASELDTLCIGVKAVPGTMKLHSIVGIECGRIKARELSCYCENCFSNGQMICHCEGWVEKTTLSVTNKGDKVPLEVRTPKVDDKDASKATDKAFAPETTLSVTDKAKGTGNEAPPAIPPQQVDDLDASTSSAPTVNANVASQAQDPIIHEHDIGHWCVIRYDGKPYPGIIQDLDPIDGEVEVKTMHRNGVNRYFWPSPHDDILWYSSKDILMMIDAPQRVGTRHVKIDDEAWIEVERKLQM